MASKQANARNFSPKTRKMIYERDNGQCIFCRMHYRMQGAQWYDLEIDGIMHFIPRSQNGMGVVENGALGCRWHHRMFDNGSEGNREEMKGLYREYLMNYYPDWNEKNIVYNKWSFLEE